MGDTSYPMRLPELELRICPAALPQATQRNAIPKIFEEASDGISLEQFDLFKILRRVAKFFFVLVMEAATPS